MIDAINWLENDSVKLLKSFAEKQMKTKKGKCHFLIIDIENITINVGGNTIEKSNCVNVDYKLKLNEYVDNIL